MEQFEYLVVDNGFMATNRTGLGSTTDEKTLSAKLTNDFGMQGWKLIGILGDDFIFIRPIHDQQIKAAQKSTKKKAAIDE